MSTAQWEAEWEYRFDERMAILCEAGRATEEMIQMARSEANAAIAQLRVVATKRRFTDAWCEGYARAHGFKYLFQGAKDGQAADRMLKTGIPWQEAMTVAEEAWKHPDWFNCRQAASLAGFICRFNEIREELRNPPLTNGALIMVRQDELRRCLDQMRQLKASYGDHQAWDQADKDKFLRLRTRRDELKKILGTQI